MVLHLTRIAAISALLLLGMIYPFLPGKYDGLAMPLSTMVQLFSAAGMLLVPIGALWLVIELRKRAQRKKNLPIADRGYYFAMASLLAASLLAILVALVVLLGIGISFGVVALGLWLYIVIRLLPLLKRLKTAQAASVNPAPLYLIVIPTVALLFQIAVAAPATAYSRNRAIASSAELIQAIEKHRAEQGRYPSSLQAVWKDYDPAVVGVEQFHYAPQGDAYNLYFEQPRFLFDNFGAREFVVYNPLDEHIISSHASWILIWSPDKLAANQGWYEVNDASSPHWRYFWFD